MQIRIFVGTGGVGKTTVAAACALKAALSGRKCLVLTIDPALRLRTALRLSPGGVQQKVELADSSARGELWAGLLDVRSTLDRAVRLYGETSQAEKVLKHPIYLGLVESLAGMQELMAIERIDQAMSDGFEDLYVDTAPARHAFEFLDKPEFFAQLVNIPLIKLVGRTYKWLEGSMFSGLGRRSVELYGRIEEVLGANLVRQVLDFYSIFRSIAEGYADRARRTSSLLHDPKSTAFFVVTTAFKAARDGNYFCGELGKRNYRVDTLIVNRLWPEIGAQLESAADFQARKLVAWYRSVSRAHARIWESLSSEFSARIPRLIALPELPRDVDGLQALIQVAGQLTSVEPDQHAAGRE